MSCSEWGMLLAKSVVPVMFNRLHTCTPTAETQFQNLLLVSHIFSLIAMNVMESKIIDNSTVCSTACPNSHGRKYQSSTLLTLADWNPSVTGGLSAQRGSNAKGISVSQRHRGKVGSYGIVLLTTCVVHLQTSTNLLSILTSYLMACTLAMHSCNASSDSKSLPLWQGTTRWC